MDAKKTDQIRETVEKLFQAAGYKAPELLKYIEELEQDHERLTQTIKKMKLDAVRKASASAGMNSRLKDALRE